MKPPIGLCALIALTLNMENAARAATPDLPWPPQIDPKNTTVQTPDGRKVERFVHGPRPAWGYPANDRVGWGYPAAQETGAAQQNHNSFYLVSPRQPRPNAPLAVVLHSANRTAYDYLGFGCLDRKIDAGDDPATTMTRVPDDFYTLYLNSTNDEWWGWSQVRQSPAYAKHINEPPPTEKRVLDTIEWVADRYKVDRNRIYLCGVSMGGCGTLGIGMPNGNVFAAIRVSVPAGTGYASYRMGGFAPSPGVDATDAERDAWKRRASAAGLPDPPVIADFSSQADMWATTQPALVEAAAAGRLPLVLCWGMFGHTTFASLIAKNPTGEVALAFPWTEIRKNEAYPVFTNASSDQRCPWLNTPAEYDEAGQSNAYFRWKSKFDAPGGFALQLWMEHPKTTKPFTMPEKATADVTLRRLQQFKVQPQHSYAWQVSRNGVAVASGKAVADAANLLTIPRVELGVAPVLLSVKLDR